VPVPEVVSGEDGGLLGVVVLAPDVLGFAAVGFFAVAERFVAAVPPALLFSLFSSAASRFSSTSIWLRRPSS